MRKSTGNSTTTTAQIHSQAQHRRRLFEEKLGENRDILRIELKTELLPSVVYSIRKEMRYHPKQISRRLNDKLAKLSDRQDRSFRNGSLKDVVTLDGVELSRFVLDVLPFSPKHSVREKFKEGHFLADLDRLVLELREINTDGEKLCEIESSANWYAKNLRETLMDRGIKQVKAHVDRLVCEFRQINTDGEKLCEIESSANWYAKNVRETLMDRGIKQVKADVDRLVREIREINTDGENYVK